MCSATHGRPAKLNNYTHILPTDHQSTNHNQPNKTKTKKQKAVPQRHQPDQRGALRRQRDRHQGLGARQLVRFWCSVAGVVCASVCARARVCESKEGAAARARAWCTLTPPPFRPQLPFLPHSPTKNTKLNPFLPHPPQTHTNTNTKLPPTQTNKQTQKNTNTKLKGASPTTAASSTPRSPPAARPPAWCASSLATATPAPRSSPAASTRSSLSAG